jgi:hypothetical protein
VTAAGVVTISAQALAGIAATLPEDREADLRADSTGRLLSDAPSRDA